MNLKYSDAVIVEIGPIQGFLEEKVANMKIFRGLRVETEQSVPIISTPNRRVLNPAVLTCLSLVWFFVKAN